MGGCEPSRSARGSGDFGGTEEDTGQRIIVELIGAAEDTLAYGGADKKRQARGGRGDVLAADTDTAGIAVIHVFVSAGVDGSTERKREDD